VTRKASLPVRWKVYGKTQANLAALIHEPTFQRNLELIQPDISIAKRHNAIYSAQNAQ
jgi:phage tail protein X